MPNQHSTLRFDQREIAVILSLSIFTSLLMFTVGIMVGKGITQSKYESPGGGGIAQFSNLGSRLPSSDASAHPNPNSLGTSVSTGHSVAHEPTKNEHTANEGTATHDTQATRETPNHLASVTDKVSEPANPHGAASAETLPAEHSAPEHGTAHVNAKDAHDLELIPEHSKSGDVRGSLADFADPNEVAGVLKNPKIKAILEDDGHSKRLVASAPSKIPSGTPKSLGSGTYTVQVGSYPTQQDATNRVEQLKKFGFPHSYFTTKELGEKKDTWYRVWLGYFSDAENAKASGELLQARGEVKSYLVRNTNSKED